MSVSAAGNRSETIADVLALAADRATRYAQTVTE